MSTPPSADPSLPGIVTLLTDFGPGSVYVGQMHGMLLARGPHLRVVDLAHDGPFAGVEAGAYLLARGHRVFPPGSVHVAVVDPGVGGARDVLAAAAGGHLFVAPDNGLLGGVLAGDPRAQVRRVDEARWMVPAASATFHGRDLMAPVAAHLACGGALDEVGPTAEAAPTPGGCRPEADAVVGCVLLVDRFGNLITNVPAEALMDLGPVERLAIGLGGASLRGLVPTFSAVVLGETLAYVGSGGNLEIAVNGGSAAQQLDIAEGAAVRVERGA